MVSGRRRVTMVMMSFRHECHAELDGVPVEENWKGREREELYTGSLCGVYQDVGHRQGTTRKSKTDSLRGVRMHSGAALIFERLMCWKASLEGLAVRGRRKTVV